MLALLGLLVLLAGFSFFTAVQALHNEKQFRASVAAIAQGWEEKVAVRALPDQELARSQMQSDKLKLDLLVTQYRQLYYLFALCLSGIVGLGLMAFLAYRFGLVLPLRRLEESCQRLINENMQGHIWGLDRSDQFGALARNICTIRQGAVRVTDMVVENEDGTQRIHFEGRAGAVFNTLINEMRETIQSLNQRGIRLEVMSQQGEESILALNDNATRQSQSLEAAVDASRVQLAALQEEWGSRLAELFHQNHQTTGQARSMVEQFTQDMRLLKDIASATSQKVHSTLQELHTSGQDIRTAAAKSMEAGESFSRQTADLTEKMSAATTLLRASGKVMSETSDAARARLQEALTSVTGHDQALRALLDDTAEKTTRITGLFDNLTSSAVHAANTVDRFEERLTQFEIKSDIAFIRLEDSTLAADRASSKLGEIQDMTEGALGAMRSHSEALAHILVAIRDEYSQLTETWQNSLQDAAPAILQLRQTSVSMQAQLREEWATYSQHSRQILGALENDVRAMNTRTQLVTQGTERLIDDLTGQAQRLNENTAHFDLQVAHLSQRLEGAATTVMQSNDSVVKATASQIQGMQGAVQDMVQRLGILGQLTGTLGSVAGQLGQIVPALSDVGQLQRAGIPLPPAQPNINPDVLEKFEKVCAALGGSIQSMREESDTVRQQVGQWVEKITSGYQKLASDIGNMDRVMESRIAELAQKIQSSGGSSGASVAPSSPATTAELLPAIKLIHESMNKEFSLQEGMLRHMQTLRGDLKNVTSDIHQTVANLKNLETTVEEGFFRLRQEDRKNGNGNAAPASSAVEASRVENAAHVLENVLGTLQHHSQDLVGRLSDITQRLAVTSGTWEGQANAVAQEARKPIPSITIHDLEGLYEQVERIRNAIENCVNQSVTLKRQAEEGHELPDLGMTREIAVTISSAIDSLQHMATYVARIADQAEDGQQRAG